VPSSRGGRRIRGGIGLEYRDERLHDLGFWHRCCEFAVDEGDLDLAEGFGFAEVARS
jgi:hypothetical protein